MRITDGLKKYCLLASVLGWQAALAQTYGTINLPAALCDAGVQIQRAAISTPTLTLWGEGPAMASNGTLFFSEQVAGNIWKVSPAGIMTKLINIGNYSNGLDFHPLDRKLVVCEKSQITERDTTTGAVLKVLATDTSNAWTAGGSGGANDLSFTTNGDMYFTTWNQHIYFRSQDGTVKKDWNFSNTYGTCEWNGIEYIEEKGFIYVCQYGENRVVTFQVDPTTHVMDTSTMKQFGPAIYGPDGITVDSNYNVYVCNNSGQGQYPNSVVVLDSSGTVLGSIKMTQSNSSSTVNCVFGNSMFGGGPNPHTLYITGDSGAFKVQLNVAGRVHPGITAEGINLQAAPGFASAHAGTAFRLFLSGSAGNSLGNPLGMPSAGFNLFGQRVNSETARAFDHAASAVYILQYTGAQH